MKRATLAAIAASLILGTIEPPRCSAGLGRDCSNPMWIRLSLRGAFK